MKKVVITGIGAVTPLANNFHDSWVKVKNGISGISRITKLDASSLKVTMTGEVKGIDLESYLSAKEIRTLDAFVHYAVAAALMAVEDAGLTNSKLLSSASIIIGSSRGGISTMEKELLKLYSLRTSPYLMPSTTISMASSYIAQKMGIKGNCLGISTACASGTNAIGEAFRLIKNGYAKLVLAGGTEAPVCMLCIEGYGASGALSKINKPYASRPFDIKRDGFVIAEGACVVVLEEYKSALKRNAKIYGEIVGYSNTTDAFHITKPDLKGEITAIQLALKDAGISHGDVDYINAHATSTLIGDKIEAGAIKAIFKDYEVPVSSIKSMTGHMLAASGAFEAACTLMSIKEGIIPPTINLDKKDPGCDINVVTKKKKADIKIAISNSFGFGGINAVLVLKAQC